MKHFSPFCQIPLIVILTMLLVLGNNVIAQSQDPCAGERAKLNTLNKQLKELQNNIRNYDGQKYYEESVKLNDAIRKGIKTLEDCVNAQGNAGNAKPGTPAKPAAPIQNGSAQPADPSNGSDKVRQALIEAQRQLDAASNFRPGTYSGMSKAKKMTANGEDVLKYGVPPPVNTTHTLESDGGKVYEVDPTGKQPRMLLEMKTKNEYAFTFNSSGVSFRGTYVFSGAGRCSYTCVSSGSGVEYESEASLALQGAPNSGDPTMSEARQKERDRILSNPLLQDPPKDAPVGDGSGKPSGFTDGVDFSTDKSQTPPATPPPDQK